MAAEPKDRNLQLRGRTYYCRVEIEGRSHRISLRTGDLETARRKRDEILTEVERQRAGLPAPEPARGWEFAVVRYTQAVLDRPGALSPTTADRYRDSLRMVGPHLQGLPLDRIDARVIAAVVRARQADGVSNATIKRDLTAISRVLAFAANEGLPTAGNAARAYDRGFLGEDRTPIRPPSDAEVAAAAQLVADAHPQWPLLVRWLRATGMRLGETLAARRADLEAVAGNRRAVRLSIYKPKGARRARMRVIVLPAEVVAMLPELGADRLFDRWDPERPGNVSTAWAAFRLSREGMPRFRLHDLRHAYAVAELRRDPTRLYPISRHLGHSSVGTTERHYLRFLSDEQQAMAKTGAAVPAPSQGPAQPTPAPRRFKLRLVS